MQRSSSQSERAGGDPAAAAKGAQGARFRSRAAERGLLPPAAVLRVRDDDDDADPVHLVLLVHHIRVRVLRGTAGALPSLGEGAVSEEDTARRGKKAFRQNHMNALGQRLCNVMVPDMLQKLTCSMQEDKNTRASDRRTFAT